MASPPAVGGSAAGYSCDWFTTGNTEALNHPQLNGPRPSDGAPVPHCVRLCVFYNPWGGITPFARPDLNTASRWQKIYGAGIDVSNTGSFQVFAQLPDTVTTVPQFPGYEAWVHAGNPVDQISAGFLIYTVTGFDPNAIYWEFKETIGRDGYYPGSHKSGTGSALSGTMPGVYVQNTCELVIVMLAHVNLINSPTVQNTIHGGPQDHGFTSHGMLLPHEFNNSGPRNWGVCMSLWSKVFTDQVGYTGDLNWRTNIRDPAEQMQSMIISIRGKPTGVFA